MTPAEDEDIRYVLITQCLQNDFFLNRQCRLSLPEREVQRMLLGTRGAGKPTTGSADWFNISPAEIASGPLGRFLDAAVGSRLAGRGRGVLHVINIRDWHLPGDGYERERQQYGTHCEAGSRGADYLTGLAQYLDPGRPQEADLRAKARYRGTDRVRVYHVHSDSVFDFKPGCERSSLEKILNVLVYGTSTEVEDMHRFLTVAGNTPGQMDYRDRPNALPTARPKVYVALIGVYTDIKILTLLIGLRTRYDIDTLAVSDVLTASPTLERHLSALNFVKRVLWGDVIHGLSDLVRLLGCENEITDESTLVDGNPYADYESYFQEKQSVLAYQDDRMKEYLRLTGQRAEQNYRVVRIANVFLLGMGMAFLSFALLNALLHPFWPDRFDTGSAVWIGGLGLAQIMLNFFSTPTKTLLQNLTNLTTLRMLLETHSFKSALARFHLTTPDILADHIESGSAEQHLATLEKELQLLEQIAASDREAFDRLGVSIPAATSPAQTRANGADKAEAPA
jgi:hypothetical protein